MKIKTRKTKLYPGDKTIQIFAERKNGDKLGLMNLTPKYHRVYNGHGNYSKRMYDNDITNRVFETITEAKDYCKTHLIPKDFTENPKNFSIAL